MNNIFLSSLNNGLLSFNIKNNNSIPGILSINNEKLEFINIYDIFPDLIKVPENYCYIQILFLDKETGNPFYTQFDLEIYNSNNQIYTVYKNQIFREEFNYICVYSFIPSNYYYKIKISKSFGLENDIETLIIPNKFISLIGYK